MKKLLKLCSIFIVSFLLLSCGCNIPDPEYSPNDDDNVTDGLGLRKEEPYTVDQVKILVGATSKLIINFREVFKSWKPQDAKRLGITGFTNDNGVASTSASDGYGPDDLTKLSDFIHLRLDLCEHKQKLEKALEDMSAAGTASAKTAKMDVKRKLVDINAVLGFSVKFALEKYNLSMFSYGNKRDLDMNTYHWIDCYTPRPSNDVAFKTYEGDIVKSNGDVVFVYNNDEIIQPNGDIKKPNGDVVKPKGDIIKPKGDIIKPKGVPGLIVKDNNFDDVRHLLRKTSNIMNPFKLAFGKWRPQDAKDARISSFKADPSYYQYINDPKNKMSNFYSSVFDAPAAPDDPTRMDAVETALRALCEHKKDLQKIVIDMDNPYIFGDIPVKKGAKENAISHIADIQKLIDLAAKASSGSDKRVLTVCP